MNDLTLKNMINRVPKSSIATIMAALIVYGVGRGWLKQTDAELIVNIMVALGLSANAYTGKFGSIGLAYAPIGSNGSDGMDSSIGPDSTLISITKSTDNSKSQASTTTTTSSVPTSSIETKTITNTVPIDKVVSVPAVITITPTINPTTNVDTTITQ